MSSRPRLRLSTEIRKAFESWIPKSSRLIYEEVGMFEGLVIQWKLMTDGWVHAPFGCGRMPQVFSILAHRYQWSHNQTLRTPLVVGLELSFSLPTWNRKANIRWRAPGIRLNSHTSMTLVRPRGSSTQDFLDRNHLKCTVRWRQFNKPPR